MAASKTAYRQPTATHHTLLPTFTTVGQRYAKLNLPSPTWPTQSESEIIYFGMRCRGMKGAHTRLFALKENAEDLEKDFLKSGWLEHDPFMWHEVTEVSCVMIPSISTTNCRYCPMHGCTRMLCALALPPPPPPPPPPVRHQPPPPACCSPICGAPLSADEQLAHVEQCSQNLIVQ